MTTMRMTATLALIVHGLSVLHLADAAFASSRPTAGTKTTSLTGLAAAAAAASPIDPAGWPDRFPAKEHCSRCGLCETTFVSKVTDACAFIGDGMRRMDDMEVQVHGRGRDVASMVWSDDNKNGESLAEEARFGVLHEPVQLARGIGIKNAQWTGCVTAIALSMLEEGLVDAVVCIANDDTGSWSSSQPILAKTSADVLRGRGVKPALAPSLQVLDAIKADSSIRKLLFCGVGCAVQAFRAVEKDLNLDEVYVMGTNCVDNSPTPEAAKNFIKDGVKIEGDDIQGYEFMQDFRVHVKTKDSYIKKPYFVLPGTIAEASIATSCLACFDYTNGLADVVVGYMGAPLDGSDRMDQAFQTLTVRNERGAEMVANAMAKNRLETFGAATGTGSHEKIAAATVSSDSIVLKMMGDAVPEKGMPGFMGEIMATVMRAVGPKGINFARYSIDYHILRNYLHVLQNWGPKRAVKHIPQYSMEIVQRYIDTDEKFAAICKKVAQSDKSVK